MHLSTYFKILIQYVLQESLTEFETKLKMQGSNTDLSNT